MNTFVYEIGRVETDLKKREAIDNLRLNDEEWGEIKTFVSLLEVCLSESINLSITYSSEIACRQRAASLFVRNRTLASQWSTRLGGTSQGLGKPSIVREGEVCIVYAST